MALPICACAQEPETTNDGNKMKITVGENTITATLVDNEATQALTALLKEGAVTISMSDYGGFEKVGALPQSLPTNDTQITTVPGDIMLYNGNQMVIFYGTNSWAYTRLGHIDALTQDEIRDALGSGTVSVKFSLPSVTGIENVSSNVAEKAVAYRIDGTVADEHVKGLVIHNGKKIFRK